MGLGFSEGAGGLLVAESTADSTRVRRALKRLDSRLALVRDFDREHQAIVYTVRYQDGSSPSVFVCDWRDHTGRPKPLSMSLVDKVRSQEDRAEELFAAAEKANDKLRADQARDTDELFNEVARYVGPSGNDVHSACFPRGIYLRRARARAREQGADV